MIMMKHWRSAMAMSVAVVLVGSLAGCNTTERRVSSAERMVREADESQQRPTDTQRTQQRGISGLKSLPKGQPLGYYSNEFNRMGYDVVDISAHDNRHVYDLRQGNERFLVGLNVAEDQNRVNDIDIQQLKSWEVGQAGGQAAGTTGQTGTTGQANRDQASMAVVQKIEQMAVGKKPYEYIPEISKFGKVTEYQMEQNSAEIEFRSADGKYYEINMSVDPNRETVNRIAVDRNVWSLL